LQEAGAQVVYGLIGFKTHSKILMVVRQERGSIRRYVHLGTGNYHPGTARLYTDYGFMSSSKKLGEDVHKVFMQLTSLTEAKDLDRVLTAPFTLFDELAARIQREIEHVATGGPARIIVKVNALIEPQIIRALYRASSAGVKIDLIVRGICSLRPGVAGLSENIRVVSIVGRFLEHSRVFYFFNGGKEEFFCSSADWMDRNFFHRNETCFPIRQQPLKKRLKKELELFLADNCQSWELHGDGSYTRTQPGEETPVAAQRTLIEQLASAKPGSPHS
jgi:polyphosphate kinase